ncbi:MULTISPECIES: hypothetical protein [Mameliella]|uniref:Uncharacterized protein n=1 Tax=Mameliella alba TaxID=561184 RepID=A0A0B3RVX8_9RHOB|nr:MULTISPECIES: hypothetical protein [Mameliella]KHQ52282.1 hypothetical protein OA50_03299 [Mameliella alba]MDD9730002.1 hypothetical protein [Mameliella sp. AT18]
MTPFGPLDFLRAAQFLRSGDPDEFAEAVPGGAPPPRPPAPKTESPRR